MPVGTLGELFEGRLEISSQHASQALLRGPTQGLLLDHFGGLRELRAQVEQGVRSLRARSEESARLREAAAERARAEDLLRFQIQEIEAAALAPDETETLPAEHRRLAHAERLRADAERAAGHLAGDPAASDLPGAADLLEEAGSRVESLAGLDPALEAPAARLREAAETAREVARELERYVQRVDLDPARLAELEERLRVVEGLRRKYGDTAREILAFRERCEAELEGLARGDARLRKLEQEQAAEHRRVEALSRALSRGRRGAARKLARAVESECAGLALEGARFQVALRPVAPAEGAPCGAQGAETPELRFSANPGEALQPLRRVVSGGELSRLFLALKNVLRQAGEGMVLVFDEVDAGIGGRVAERVGALLASLAEHHQVLCITHLPQIAVHAERHFRVVKRGRGGRTLTRVEALDPAARIEEVARMAGGEEVREATRAHARALLEAARGPREA